VVVLAAGKGTRLGRSLPKPLTMLRDGRSILEHQIDALRQVLGVDIPITLVVGFQAEVVMAAAPDLTFAYNPDYDWTNTAKSLLRGLQSSRAGGVLWLNGDVVFDPELLHLLRPLADEGQTFVCVNTAVVAEEEVKYTVDAEGFVRALSKTVVGGLGEAMGINFVADGDKAQLIRQLERCSSSDYFERGLEVAIEESGLRVVPVDVSAFDAVEVDFEDDLQRANLLELHRRPVLRLDGHHRTRRPVASDAEELSGPALEAEAAG
jgi:choline kinase